MIRASNVPRNTPTAKIRSFVATLNIVWCATFLLCVRGSSFLNDYDLGFHSLISKRGPKEPALSENNLCVYRSDQNKSNQISLLNDQDMSVKRLKLVVTDDLIGE